MNSKNGISLSSDLIRPRDQRVIGLYGQELIKVNYHLTRFDCHRHCGSKDIMILVCKVILQDHVIKRLCDFMGRSSLMQVTILPSLVTIVALVVEI